jgi:succinyl-CoA synthetase beta subunit
MDLIDYERARALLEKYKIRSVESRYVKNAEEAIKFSKGKAIVLKAISQKALHKTRNKLVALNLDSDKAIKENYSILEKRAAKFKPYKIIAQKMVEGNIEIIIGGKTDSQFGKMLLLGLGGIYVETFKDFSLRVCPITRYDAESMLNQLKSSPIIAPNPATAKKLIDLLLKVSRMFENNSITELDLNPIIVHDNTYDAVDLRIIK